MQYFCTYIVAKIRILINMSYHVGMDYAPPIFLCRKISHNTASFLLSSKNARSVHLFACKRTHDGSQSLPPFCEKVPVAQMVQNGLRSIPIFLFPNNRLFPNLFSTPGGRGNTELFFESFVKDMSIIVAHALGSCGHGRVCVF